MIGHLQSQPQPQTNLSVQRCQIKTGLQGCQKESGRERKRERERERADNKNPEQTAG